MTLLEGPPYLQFVPTNSETSIQASQYEGP